jgi:Na+/melibiose symporter-like transporter
MQPNEQQPITSGQPNMPKASALPPPQKLSVLEKVGYSLGDLAANLIFQTLLAFLAFFYTDIYKIPPTSASQVMLIGGIIGACFNLVMGAIADRTQTRWGKFRPWVLWTAVPFGVISLLAFRTPDFSEGGKVAYAFVTYFLLVIAYSANNLPYSALSGVLTGDMKERNSLSSYRFVAVMVAQFIIQVLLLPLALALGGGDKPAQRAHGFEKVMLVFAITGVICFLITFLTTRERVHPPKEQKTPVGQDLADLFSNRPWLIMLALTILVFITLSIKGGMNIYYFKYFLAEGSESDFLSKVGFNSILDGLGHVFGPDAFKEFQKPGSSYYSAASFANAFSTIAMIIGILFSKSLADKFGKRNVFGIFLTVSALCIMALYFFNNTAVMAAFIILVLHGLIYGITIPILWAMIADVADYSEWKKNRRATAIIFSAMIFGLKFGLSVGGALSAWLLGMFGYVADAPAQTASALSGIRLLMSVIPGLIFIGGALLLFAYPIDKKMEVTIESDLKARKKILSPA